MRFAPLSSFKAPSGHALCRHLRCKEMYYSTQELAERAARAPAEAFENRYFWCLKTYVASGPDQARCGAEECRPGRDCYEAQ